MGKILNVPRQPGAWGPRCSRALTWKAVVFLMEPLLTNAGLAAWAEALESTPGRAATGHRDMVMAAIVRS